MTNEEELRSLLRDIRDNQIEPLKLKRARVEYAKQQLERFRTQVA